MVNFILRNPLDLNREVIKFSDKDDKLLRVALLRMGYTRTFSYPDYIYRTCPLGTFSEGNGKCMECPPGLLSRASLLFSDEFTK